MPVRKFHSVQDAEDTVWRKHDDPDLLRVIRAVWTLSARLCPRHFPPGVYKHHTIEDANRLEEAWQAHNAERARP